MINKKAISLMISYVILVAIVISVSVGVYAYLRVSADISPAVDCKDGTSVIIEEYECFTGDAFAAAGIDLEIKNNGRFSIDGVMVVVGPDSQKAPDTYLIPDSSTVQLAGHYFFTNKLKPGESETAEFSNKDSVAIGPPVTFDTVEVIQIQPFVIEGTSKVVCTDAVIKQDVQNCKINP